MSDFQTLSLLISVLSATIAFVSLYRTRKVAKAQIELQKRQVALSAESAALAKVQREMIQQAKRFPDLTVDIFAVTIHYEDGDLNDTAVRLIFFNRSSLNASLNDCLVGLLDKPSDRISSIARQAEYQDKLAQYPISIAPNTSLIQYSFARRLKEAYDAHYPTGTTEPKSVAVLAHFAGFDEPLVKVIGSYSPNSGLRSN